MAKKIPVNNTVRKLLIVIVSIQLWTGCKESSIHRFSLFGYFCELDSKIDKIEAEMTVLKEKAAEHTIIVKNLDNDMDYIKGEIVNIRKDIFELKEILIRCKSNCQAKNSRPFLPLPFLSQQRRGGKDEGIKLWEIDFQIMTSKRIHVLIF